MFTLCWAHCLACSLAGGYGGKKQNQKRGEEIWINSRWTFFNSFLNLEKLRSDSFSAGLVLTGPISILWLERGRSCSQVSCKQQAAASLQTMAASAEMTGKDTCHIVSQGILWVQLIGSIIKVKYWPYSYHDQHLAALCLILLSCCSCQKLK